MISFAILGLDNWYHSYPICEVLSRRDDTAIGYIVDRDETRAGATAGRYQATSFGTDVEACFADESVDAVMIGSYTTLHEALILEAARCGKAILCDKPLAHDLEAAKRIAAAIDHHHTKFMMSFPNRINPELLKIKALLDEERRYGHPAVISWVGRWPLPKADLLANEPGWYADPAMAAHGAFLDHAVHQFDALRWLLESEATSVSAHITNLFSKELAVDDYGVATVEFADGSVATVESGWVVSPCSSYTDKLFIETPQLGIVRERGSVTVHSCVGGHKRSTPYPFELGPSTEVTAGHRVHLREFERVVDRFIRYLSGETDPIATCQDGLKSLEICELAYRASQQRATLSV